MLTLCVLQGKQAVKRTRAQHSLIRKASERSSVEESSVGGKRSVRKGKREIVIDKPPGSHVNPVM